jgi:uncharacterized membrane protein
MDEKRTLGEFIRDNKGKIIKWSLVAVGATVGVLIVLRLKNGGEETITMIENLSDEAVDAVLTTVEAAKKIGA